MHSHVPTILHTLKLYKLSMHSSTPPFIYPFIHAYNPMCQPFLQTIKLPNHLFLHQSMQSYPFSLITEVERESDEDPCDLHSALYPLWLPTFCHVARHHL